MTITVEDGKVIVYTLNADDSNLALVIKVKIVERTF